MHTSITVFANNCTDPPHHAENYVTVQSMLLLFIWMNFLLLYSQRDFKFWVFTDFWKIFKKIQKSKMIMYCEWNLSTQKQLHVQPWNCLIFYRLSNIRSSGRVYYSTERSTSSLASLTKMAALSQFFQFWGKIPWNLFYNHWYMQYSKKREKNNCAVLKAKPKFHCTLTIERSGRKNRATAIPLDTPLNIRNFLYDSWPESGRNPQSWTNRCKNRLCEGEPQINFSKRCNL